MDFQSFKKKKVVDEKDRDLRAFHLLYRECLDAAQEGELMIQLPQIIPSLNSEISQNQTVFIVVTNILSFFLSLCIVSLLYFF